MLILFFKCCTFLCKLGASRYGLSDATLVNRFYECNCRSLKFEEVCFLRPIYTSSEKRPLISDHIKGPLVAVFRSPLMKALDRSIETLGLWIVTSSVTLIKSVNQSSIKPCLIVHLVAVWTLIYFEYKYLSLDQDNNFYLINLSILITFLDITVNIILGEVAC